MQVQGPVFLTSGQLAVVTGFLEAHRFVKLCIGSAKNTVLLRG